MFPWQFQYLPHGAPGACMPGSMGPTGIPDSSGVVGSNMWSAMPQSSPMGMMISGCPGFPGMTHFGAMRPPQFGPGTGAPALEEALPNHQGVASAHDQRARPGTSGFAAPTGARSEVGERTSFPDDKQNISSSYRFLGSVWKHGVRQALPKKFRITLLLRMNSVFFTRALLARASDTTVDYCIYICCHMPPHTRIADLACPAKGAFRDMMADEYERYRRIQPQRFDSLSPDLANAASLAIQLGYPWNQVCPEDVLALGTQGVRPTHAGLSESGRGPCAGDGGSADERERQLAIEDGEVLGEEDELRSNASGGTAGKGSIAPSPRGGRNAHSSYARRPPSAGVTPTRKTVQTKRSASFQDSEGSGVGHGCDDTKPASLASSPAAKALKKACDADSQPQNEPSTEEMDVASRAEHSTPASGSRDSVPPAEVQVETGSEVPEGFKDMMMKMARQKEDATQEMIEKLG